MIMDIAFFMDTFFFKKFFWTEHLFEILNIIFSTSGLIFQDCSNRNGKQVHQK